ncbi:MAG: hypothetical protein E6H09_06690 [Bacteroidetes bacterium]|jgi:hypothetical protein|nr:MAG: hypothetical protein E6H09_06690 [Bacteroidota bacterium]
MRKFLYQCLYFLLLVSVLPSCEFRCNVGEQNEKKERKANRPVIKDGGSTVIYNGIELETHLVKVRKAYLVYDDGQRVPDNNVVDFTKPVKMIVFVDSGWTIHDNQVLLGASEKVTNDAGRILLSEKDLFAKSHTRSISAEDARIISLTVTLTLTSSSERGFVTISFTIWDKMGPGYVRGEYRLYTN